MLLLVPAPKHIFGPVHSSDLKRERESGLWSKSLYRCRGVPLELRGNLELGDCHRGQPFVWEAHLTLPTWIY